MPLTKIDDRGLTTPVDLLDNERIRLGTGNDLQIYHNGSNSYIDDAAGTGALIFKSNFYSFRNAPDNATIAQFSQGGAVELYYSNSKKLETTSSGALVTGDFFLNDNGKLTLGTGGDFKIYHNGSDTYFEAASTAGQIIHSANEWRLQNLARNENMILANQDGLVRLYYDGSTKFETTSNGAAVTGDLAISGEVNLTTGGNYNRFIDASLDNGEALFLRSTNGGDANHQNMAIFHRGGSVELYHAAAKKFETTSYGNASAGQVRVTASNASTVAFSCGDVGTGFYNSGSNAIGYATNGTQKWNIGSGGHISLLDDVELRLGTDADLRLSHSGTYNNSLIYNNTNDLYFRSGTAFYFQNKAGNENLATFVENGRVDLYYDNSKKFETTTYGTRTTGYHTQSTAIGFQGDAADWTSSQPNMHNMSLMWNSGHLNNSTGVFTCPVAGKYLCSASVQAHRTYNSSGASSTYYNVLWQKNSSNYHTEVVGTSSTDAGARSTTDVNGKHETVTATIIMDCAANDTIRAHSNHGYRHNTQNICSVYFLG
tara:strand:- start:352 stop:1977 length:1626 start_codon:yes stop_codon:yes gene_type:complete